MNGWAVVAITWVMCDIRLGAASIPNEGLVTRYLKNQGRQNFARIVRSGGGSST